MDRFEIDQNSAKTLARDSFRQERETPFAEILKDKILRSFIEKTLENVLTHLGIDQETVPEYFTLHILEVR